MLLYTIRSVYISYNLFTTLYIKKCYPIYFLSLFFLNHQTVLRHKLVTTIKAVMLRFAKDEYFQAGKVQLDSVCFHFRVKVLLTILCCSQILQPRLLYPTKLSFRMEARKKCFPDKVKLKEFTITKPVLHEVLKGIT